MTRQALLNLFILFFLLSVCPDAVQPASAASAAVDDTDNKPALVPAKPLPAPKLPAMDFPENSLHANGHKMHMQKIEELGKIHRFHKDRVKKVKKHQGEFWLAALVLVVSCHLALLIHAFMHLTH